MLLVNVIYTFSIHQHTLVKEFMFFEYSNFIVLSHRTLKITLGHWWHTYHS